MAMRTVWISGASSGIGAAVAQALPYEDAQLIGIARRSPPIGDHLQADLSEPAGWETVKESFERTLGSGECEHAVFLHFAGEGSPHGRASDADPQVYARSVMLNAAAGMVLGQHFMHSCRSHAVASTLVVCSSPGALEMHRGMAHYGAAKSALLHWTSVVREEEPDSTVLIVIPWATDTPMLRLALEQPADENPLSGELREAYGRGEFATPEEAAAVIWEAVLAGAPESPLHVGRVPDGLAPTA